VFEGRKIGQKPAFDVTVEKVFAILYGKFPAMAQGTRHKERAQDTRKKGQLLNFQLCVLAGNVLEYY